MVTHDSFTASYCRRILFIKDGKIFNEIHRGTKSRKDGYTLLLPAGHLIGIFFQDLLDIQCPCNFLYPFINLFCLYAGNGQGKGDILIRSQCIKQIKVLKNKAQLFAPKSR